MQAVSFQVIVIFINAHCLFPSRWHGKSVTSQIINLFTKWRCLGNYYLVAFSLTISLTHPVITSMSAYTPYLSGCAQLWPQDTTPVRYHSPSCSQASGPPLSYWHVSTPPSSKPAHSALLWMVPSYDSFPLHLSSCTSFTLASLRISGFGPLHCVWPQPVT